MNIPLPNKPLQVVRLFADDDMDDIPPFVDDPKWIDKSIEYPIMGRVVWIKRENNEIMKAFYMYSSFFNKWYWVDRYRDYLIKGVKYWMPLPDPPKE